MFQNGTEFVRRLGLQPVHTVHHIPIPNFGEGTTFAGCPDRTIEQQWNTAGLQIDHLIISTNHVRRLSLIRFFLHDGYDGFGGSFFQHKA